MLVTLQFSTVFWPLTPASSRARCGETAELRLSDGAAALGDSKGSRQWALRDKVAQEGIKKGIAAVQGCSPEMDL